MLESLGKYQMETRRRERAVAAQEAAEAAKREAERAARLTKSGLRHYSKRALWDNVLEGGVDEVPDGPFLNPKP